VRGLDTAAGRGDGDARAGAQRGRIAGRAQRVQRVQRVQRE